ncbi:hypothetical protein [Streptomyces sp. NPDC047097]|uniref:hypothetical protein n=1 Tax=Streptomyces sp. NPDC047097 TaxID=3155260 RepID=UPI0033D63AE5
MADANFSVPTHPLANPGYGKRTVPGQEPPTTSDFAHLPRREASIAGYIERLTDGSDIAVKTLAAVLPDYGQCAVRTALSRLAAAGHLRRGRECIVRPDGARWITRTWWSRTPRDDAWWAAYQRGEITEDKPPPRRRQTRSRAFVLLAALGRQNPMMSLSDGECVALEPLVSEWFARGADERVVLNALTAGLPRQVHRPVALARTRLTGKMPPEPIEAERPVLRMLECAKCRVPGRPEVLADGVCGPCRGEPAPAPPPRPLFPEQVRAHVAEARRAAARPRTPEGSVT